MSRTGVRSGALLLLALSVLWPLPPAAAATTTTTQRWRPNDPHRPQPPLMMVSSALLGLPPPPDATVLFDGHGLSAWDVAADPGHWNVQGGVLRPGGALFNKLVTKAHFGSIQVHLEFREPYPPAGHGQHRGNSGVFLMGVYEIQILDPVDNPTYADGVLGAVYGQTPPLVIAARRPGQWQSLDILFDAPRFAGARLLVPPYVTVLLNGVVAQDHQEIFGNTSSRPQPLGFVTRAGEGPLGLQDHGTPTDIVAFRNIWVRPLGDAHDGR